MCTITNKKNARVSACMSTCMRACVRACVCACVRMQERVFIGQDSVSCIVTEHIMPKPTSPHESVISRYAVDLTELGGFLLLGSDKTNH